MRNPLNLSDRTILIGSFTVLALLVTLSVVLSPSGQFTMKIPCSYYSDPSGARAAYLLLVELGYDVERWVLPAADLPEDPRGVTLVVARPFVLSGHTRQRLLEFVRRGGRLLTTDAPSTGLMPGVILATPDDHDGGLEPEERTYRAIAPTPLTVGASEIVMSPRAVWKGGSGDSLELYGDDDAVTVVEHRLGEGRIIWWAAPTPLSNAGLTEKRNVELFLNSVGPPGVQRVLWDEFSHGHGGSLFSRIGRTPLVWALPQVGLILMAVIVSFARRSGPIRPVVETPRLSPLEFVESLGDLYASARAAPAAVGISSTRFRALLARRLRLSVSATPEELAQTARERLGYDDSTLLDDLRDSARAAGRDSINDRMAVRLVQALHDHARALGLGRDTSREKPR